MLYSISKFCVRYIYIVLHPCPGMVRVSMVADTWTWCPPFTHSCILYTILKDVWSIYCVTPLSWHGPGERGSRHMDRVPAPSPQLFMHSVSVWKLLRLPAVRDSHRFILNIPRQNIVGARLHLDWVFSTQVIFFYVGRGDIGWGLQSSTVDGRCPKQDDQKHKKVLYNFRSGFGICFCCGCYSICVLCVTLYSTVQYSTVTTEL